MSDIPSYQPFPRSDGPLISVSLPTRGRPQLLIKAIESLHNRAANPLQIEYLFRVDSDDIPTIQTCSQLVSLLPQASLVVEPRGTGYLQIHLMHGRLCSLARGDWILVFNDDALMTTQGWDTIISDFNSNAFPNPDIAMIFLPSKDRPICNEFFLLRRKVLDVLGYFSLSPHADNWLHRVLSLCGSCGRTEKIVIEHNSHLMEDKTREESVAAYADGDLAKRTLESPEAQMGIMNSVEKLRAYIEGKRQRVE